VPIPAACVVSALQVTGSLLTSMSPISSLQSVRVAS
jgi:hypothetical protein